jgi:hypothetical protein
MTYKLLEGPKKKKSSWTSFHAMLFLLRGECSEIEKRVRCVRIVTFAKQNAVIPVGDANSQIQVLSNRGTRNTPILFDIMGKHSKLLAKVGPV